MSSNRIVLVTVWCLLAGSLFGVPALGRAQTAPDNLTKHVFTEPAHQVRSYWTPRRMRAAEPLLDVTQRIAVARPPKAPKPHPHATPTSAPDETSLSFVRQEIQDPSDPAYRVHGKLFIHSSTGDVGYCSATAMDTPNGSVIFTAAHCLYDPEYGGWATDLNFVPGYRLGQAPYGEWVGYRAAVPNEWVDYQAQRLDFGAVTMLPRKGQRLFDIIGGKGFRTSVLGTHFEAFGYPADDPFNGERLYVCIADGFVYDGDQPGAGPESLGIGCDMTEGSSGGGWIVDGAYLNSVNAYGYFNPATGSDYEIMYGPQFGDTANTLFLDVGDDLIPGAVNPTPIVTPTPTITDVPSPSGSPAPTSSPYILPTRKVTYEDLNDSPGLFDLREVTVAEGVGSLTISIQTHDEWGARLLSGAHPANSFRIDLDTLEDPRPDSYVYVYYQGGRLWTNIFVHADSHTEEGVVVRPTRRDMILTFQTSTLPPSTKLRFDTKTKFRGAGRCPKICADS